MLYVIYSKPDNSIIGITEYKVRLLLFIEQTKINSKDIGYFKIEDIDRINKYLIKYDNLILEDYYHTILTNEDMKIFSNIIKEEKDKLKDILSDLDHVLKNYKLNKTEKVSIKNCIDTITEFKKKPSIVSRLSIKEIFLNKLTSLKYKKTREFINSMKDMYDSKK